MVQLVKELLNSTGSCVNIVVVPLFEGLSVLLFEKDRVFLLNHGEDHVFDVDENVLRCVLMDYDLFDDLGSEQGHAFALRGFVFV